MSDARTDILAALRGARGGPAPDQTAANALTARITTPPAHPRPAWTDDPVERFIERFTARSGTVARLASSDAIPTAVADFRATHDLPARAAVGAALADLPWPAEWALHHGPAGPDELLSVSLAFAGVAESGTLVLLAGLGSPTTHNFVPDNQIVVLPVARLVRQIEMAWAWLRERPEGMPRVVNCIAGPSRTADIEQTITLGAHGPRRLHVLLIG